MSLDTAWSSIAPIWRGYSSKNSMISTCQSESGGGKQRQIAVRLADCEGLRNQASILVNRMYAGRGYGAGHHLDGADHSATFTATTDDEVVGTVTLTVDTLAGLSTDQTFKNELDQFRATPGIRLCELTKFAVDPATKSPQALAALFHVIFIYGMQRFDCTDLLIEVHPRHVRYYEVMLGFGRVGPPKIDASVTWWPSDVPVQLMRLRVADIGRQIELHAGSKTGCGRSLYNYFFSAAEVEGIASRVAAVFGNNPAAVPGLTQLGVSNELSSTQRWQVAA